MAKRSLFFVLMILLSGCTTKIGEDVFITQVDELELALDQQDWNQITHYAEELKTVYQDEKWKIQLIGDEGEYEGLLESINKLIAATKEKDIKNVRMELASTKTLIEDIYSL
ncbi:DUF4363 family protein [Lentibacillus cibarius]|uniref:DUF4363 family protein n=1 Tax=Lentibacillus cibarius TaxID=2583219 RepID=A0A549YHY0_9BACI|nr:DUF4363 family protein [Lentibacillus cibarius]TRM11490.1 DUF4363 family protein [Lentibacillus cibarius]